MRWPSLSGVTSDLQARLDATFKAYDVRGTVPDQIDEDLEAPEVEHHDAAPDDHRVAPVPSDESGDGVAIHPADLPGSAVRMPDTDVILIAVYEKIVLLGKPNTSSWHLTTHCYASPRAAFCHFSICAGLALPVSSKTLVSILEI